LSHDEGYSFLYDPNLCLLFEPMEAISSTLIRTALITYANELGTTTNVASIQGLLSGITFGLGYLMKTFLFTLFFIEYAVGSFTDCFSHSRLGSKQLWRKPTYWWVWPASDFPRVGCHVVHRWVHLLAL
jgi:hypothetical protein